jgi:hypothetical protein
MKMKVFLMFMFYIVGSIPLDYYLFGQTFEEALLSSVDGLFAGGALWYSYSIAKKKESI